LHAGPVPAFLDTLRIDITEITWKITPDWDSTQRKTVKITPTPPTAIGSVRLPVPTGEVKTVTVEISGKWSTQGGNVGGYDIPAQTGQVATDIEKVAFTGSDELIAWLLTVPYVADGNVVRFGVVPKLQGIKP
jgi:hypothetical protein